MAFVINDKAVFSAYQKLSSEQKERFFRGKEAQAKKVIGSLVFLLGAKHSYEKLLDLYITSAVRVMMGFPNERIIITVKMRFSDIVPESKALAAIDCIRRIAENYAFIDKANSPEMQDYIRSFDSQNSSSFLENERRFNDAFQIPDFGTDPNNPIFTHCTDGSYHYLNLLYTSDLVPLTWSRVRSIEVSSSSDPVDEYELLLPDGTVYLTVYINMYSRKNSVYCPQGLVGSGLKEVPSVTQMRSSSEDPAELSEEDEYLAFLKTYAKNSSDPSPTPKSVVGSAPKSPPKFQIKEMTEAEMKAKRAKTATREDSQKSSPFPETNETTKKINQNDVILAIIVVFFLLFVGYNLVKNSSQMNNGSNTPTTAQATDPMSEHIQKAEKYLSSGDYYRAYQEIEKCNNSTDSSVAKKRDEIISKIEKAVKKNEPESGMTLERTFKYQGGCIIRVTAKTGAAHVTVKSKDKPSEFVRFYVRKGETAEINLTGGTYKVSYQVGDLWFDNSTGFGKYCTKKDLPNDYVFKTTQVVGWVSNDVLELTV